MSARLDTEQVWNALAAEPAFNRQVPPAAQQAFKEVVAGLPETLAKHLDEKVTLPTLMGAKLDLLERLLDTGFFGKMFALLPAEMLPFPVEEMAEMAAAQLKTQRGPLMEMVKNTEAFLASYGVTERQLMAAPTGGNLNAANLAAYDAGTLTIRGLLETQPAAVIMNGG
jgi:negative regulator of sigma E activity